MATPRRGASLGRGSVFSLLSLDLVAALIQLYDSCADTELGPSGTSSRRVTTAFRNATRRARFVTVCSFAQDALAHRQLRRRLSLAEKLADHAELAAKVDRGELDGRRAEELARLERFERRRESAPPTKPVRVGAGVEIRCGDFRKVLSSVKDHSVDAIVTDPPTTPRACRCIRSSPRSGPGS